MDNVSDPGTQPQLRLMLERAVAGDAAALDVLLRHTQERLQVLAQRMLARFPRVRRWAETGDVLQNALVRLIGSLQAVKPTSVRAYLGLASLQLRRELIDLARHHYGPQGAAAHHDSVVRNDGRPDQLQQAAALTGEPLGLLQWSELHEKIGGLPEEEREVVELVYYQGMSQAEAAEVLGVAVRTIQRRWHAALLKLHDIWSRCAGPTHA